MSIDALISSWRDVRNGLIDEVSLVPEDKFSFQATPNTRTIAQILQHIIQTQKTLVGEVCRPDTNFGKGFSALFQEHASGVAEVEGKDALLKLLAESMDQAEAQIRSFGEESLQTLTARFDGKQVPKEDFIAFSISHEMYHRGQLTVYERLLNIEPALTTRFKKFFATRG